MPALSYVMPFYRNSDMLAEHYRIWADYPEAVKRQIEIVLVDDGSPEPAIDVPRPMGLPDVRIFRVLEDRPWHQHGARNLGAHVANADWLFLTDMDHVLPAESAESLLHRLNAEVVYTFHRLDAPKLTPKLDSRGQLHPHPNTFAMRRSQYWAIGGYDEDCVGYGTDGFFRSRLYPVVHLNVPVIRYAREVIHDASTRDANRHADRQTSRNLQLIDEKKRDGRGPTVMNFPWEQVL